MCSAYLSVGHYNVIAVDWSEYTFPYVAAANNARAVGHVIGRYITFLARDGGLKMSDLHIIGHSLGAHVAAFAAEGIKSNTKPARITGGWPSNILAGIIGKMPNNSNLFQASIQQHLSFRKINLSTDLVQKMQSSWT